MRKIEIALPKGKRLLSQAYEVFKKIGYPSATLEEEIKDQKGKLLQFESDNGEIMFLLIRIADIPQFIDKNWADVGITAFDCYREYELASVSAKGAMRGDNFISDILPDLKLCQQSRFCVAGVPEKRAFYEKCKKSDEKILEVATQNPNIAAKYFQSQGVVADIISVSGSCELMSKYGRVDVIFDVVETGRALAENGLEIFEEAFPIQTRILVSKAALKYDPQIEKILRELKNEIK